MNAQRLMRQLRREVKANPKRAALLAGLVAVGIYFWAPLVAGWVMPDQAATAPAPAKKGDTKSPANTLAPAGQAVTELPKRTNTTPWTQLWAAIQDDKRTKPAAALVAAADPFRPFPPPPETAEQTADDDTESEPGSSTAKRAAPPRGAGPIEVTPKSLGMKLTGTVIGSRRRAAVIDGKIVPEGGLVSPTAGDGKPSSTKPDAAKIAFRLARVEHQSIVLERGPKKYTLTIEIPQAEGVELEARPPEAL